MKRNYISKVFIPVISTGVQLRIFGREVFQGGNTSLFNSLPKYRNELSKGRHWAQIATPMSPSLRGQGEEFNTSRFFGRNLFDRLSLSKDSSTTEVSVQVTLGMTKVGNRLMILLAILAIFIASCKPKPQKEHHDLGKVTVDSTLKALVKPSNELVVGKATLVKASHEAKIFMAEVQGIVNYDLRSETSVASRIAGRLEKLWIKYNYQPVSKGQLLFEIYAPDLAAAQQELIYLSQSEGDQQLLERAKQRLMLLGMSAQSVQAVLRSKKVNYRIPVYSPTDGFILEKSAASAGPAAPSSSMTPSSSSGGDGMSGMSGGGSASAAPAPTKVESTPVLLREGQYVSAGEALFTIYQSNQLLAEFMLKPDLAAFVGKGTKLAFFKTADREGTFQTAAIGMIQPTIKAGENFTLARVYLNQKGFKAGEILTAKIPVLVPRSYWLPASAVLTMGNKSIVFKKEGAVMVAQDIQTGIRMDGMVQVKSDIADWQLAKNSAYLVDSESFVKSK